MRDMTEFDECMNVGAGALLSAVCLVVGVLVLPVLGPLFVFGWVVRIPERRREKNRPKEVEGE